MEPSVQNQVTKILIKDAKLVEDRKMFYDSLNLDNSEYSVLNNRFITGIVTSYELFSDFLVKWVNRNSESVTTVTALCEILKNDGFKNVTDQLKLLTAPMGRKGKLDTPLWFEVSKRAKNFVGRTEELDKLKKFLKTDEDIVTITGMGGIGKTELVKTFAKQIADEDQVDCIFLNGESEKSLISSIFRLAQSQGISTVNDSNQPKDTTSIFTDIIQSIHHQYKIVVIIDNVDKENKIVSLILDDLDVCRKNCYFLFTSRKTSVLDYAGEIIPLDVLSNEEAQELVKNAVPHESDKSIKEHCNLLGNFPLALQQAVGFLKVQQHEGIEGKSYGIWNYMETYQEQQADLLDFPLNKYDHDYKLTTMITWRISIDKIREHDALGELAIYLLNVLAYFECDIIWFEFITAFYATELEEFFKTEYDRVANAAALLQRYSLIKMERKRISIHRLLREVIRIKMSLDNSEVPHLRKMMTAIHKLLIWVEGQVGLKLRINIPSDWQKSKTDQLLKHIDSGMDQIELTWEHITKHDELVREFKKVVIEIFNSSMYSTNPCASRDLLKKSHTILKSTLGDDDYITLKVEYYLTAFKSGNNLKKINNVYSKQQRILGEDHETTIQTAEYIATSLRLEVMGRNFRTGCYNKSIEMYQNVINLKKRILVPEHKSIMQTKYKLAQLLDELYENEAVKLYEECFDWMKNNFGRDNLETLEIMHEFGQAAFKFGNYGKSEDTFKTFMELKSIQDSNAGHSYMLFNIHFMMQIVSRDGWVFNEHHFSKGWMTSRGEKRFNRIKSEFQRAETLFNQRNYEGALVILKNVSQDIIMVTDFYRWDQYRWILDHVVDHKISLCLTKLCKIQENSATLEILLDDVRECYDTENYPVHDKMRELIVKCRSHMSQLQLQQFTINHDDSSHT